jgi:hypothetical protein
MLKNKSEVVSRHLDCVLLRVAISSSDDASLLANCIYSLVSFKLHSLEGIGTTLQYFVALADLLLERCRSCRSAVWVRNPGLGWVSDISKLVQIVPVTRHIVVCREAGG